MAKKVRYRFNTSYNLKRTHAHMLKNFDVSQVSSNNTKHDGYHMFFTVRDEVEEARIKSHFKKIGIELTKIS